MILTNQEIAILSRVNELAERRGIKPYEFVAEYHEGDNCNGVRVEFTIPPQDDKQRIKFDKMLENLGVFGADVSSITGSVKHVIDAIDHAISISPRSRLA